MTCKVRDCETQAHCRGWCNKHYKRWRTTGDPQRTVKRKYPNLCPAGHRFNKENTLHNTRGFRVCLACKRFKQRVHARQVRAEGRAAAHRPGYWVGYHRQVRQGERVPKPRVKVSSSITAQVIDLLLIEGTWMTPHEIAHRLDASLETVRTTLNRLRTKGKAQSHRVDLSDRTFRTEWKFLLSEADSV